MPRPPRILYVSSVYPDKSSFGGEIRSFNVLSALQQIGKVEVLVLDDKVLDTRSVIAESEVHALTRILAVQQRPNEGLIQKISWTLDPNSDYPNGCGVSESALRSLVPDLSEFDLIWFFQLRSPDAFPNAVWPRSVVDVDNLPSMYERAALAAGCGTVERLSVLRRLVTWRRREQRLGSRFDVLAVCSEADRAYLEQIGVKIPIRVIPNGFAKPAAEPIRSRAIPPRIGFIGLFEYSPNRDGVMWFVNRCWPRIKAEVPEARFRLVGRDSDGALKPLGPDIDGLGWIENPAEEISTWSAMVVPLHVGAGTRVKIAHGFSRKCPIVSTSLGARGYGAVDGREMFLADSAEAFSAACIRAIREPEKAAEMAEVGWREFVDKWTWDAIRLQVWAAAEDCLRLNHSVGS
jgi:glycosyltransferase involved in cell wall biosynthesis